MSDALSTILVHVDRSDAAAARVALAADLADRFGAKLAGAAAAQPYIPVYAPFGESLIMLQPEIVQAARDQATGELNAAEAAFRNAAGGRDADWRGALATDSAAHIAAIARGADLIVAGRPDKARSADMLALAAADLVMTAGRPVLVTPPGVTRLSAARIVVGWKDGREARRAALDALPFLKRGEEVFIVVAGNEPDTAAASDVAAWLAGHGVNARPVSEKTADSAAAEALLTVAHRVDADLIVAGAFGHSRMREWAFGGVTRDLLAAAAVPVLFAH